MKSKILLPAKFKRIGWFLFIPSLLLGIMVLFFEFEFDFLDAKVFALYTDSIGTSGWFKVVENNYTDEICAFILIIASLMVAFSRENEEDEFIASLRTESLLWSVYVNYLILLISIFFFYEFGFLYVLILNMFTTLFFFIMRFNVLLLQSRKANEA